METNPTHALSFPIIWVDWGIHSKGKYLIRVSSQISRLELSYSGCDNRKKQNKTKQNKKTRKRFCLCLFLDLDSTLLDHGKSKQFNGGLFLKTIATIYTHTYIYEFMSLIKLIYPKRFLYHE